MGQMKIHREIINKVNAYIDDRRRRVYEKGEKAVHPRDLFERCCHIEKFSGRMSDKIFSQLKSKLAKKEESFTERLLRLIDESGMTDAEVYKRAGIDRKYFSKLRNEKERIPKAKVVYAFIFALGLGLGEAKKLLASAGYAVSPARAFDLVMEFCIIEGYDIDEVNEILFAMNLPPLT